MGFKNGQIPATALKKSVLGVSLTAAAASSIARLKPVFERDTGIKLVATSGYRPLAEQKSLFLKRYKVQLLGRGKFGDVRWYGGKRYVRISGDGAVAVPGSSNHGLGLALDLELGDWGSKADRWFEQHGPAYGWLSDEGHAVGEPWHKRYDPAKDLHRKATVVTTTALNVRRTPNGARVGGLKKGAKVVVFALYRAKAGGLVWLKTADGKFIAQKFTR